MNALKILEDKDNKGFCRLKLSRRMTLRLPEHLSKAITNMAKREGTMPSDLVRRLVTEALAARMEVTAITGDGGSNGR